MARVLRTTEPSPMGNFVTHIGFGMWASLSIWMWLLAGSASRERFRLLAEVHMGVGADHVPPPPPQLRAVLLALFCQGDH